MTCFCIYWVFISSWRWQHLWNKCSFLRDEWILLSPVIQTKMKNVKKMHFFILLSRFHSLWAENLFNQFCYRKFKEDQKINFERFHAPKSEKNCLNRLIPIDLNPYRGKKINFTRFWIFYWLEGVFTPQVNLLGEIFYQSLPKRVF